jgi:hemin uptake protein HemP
MMSEADKPERQEDEPKKAGITSSQVPTVRAGELLQGGREVRIVHNGEVYRLLVTRNNKLILQK